MGLVGAALCIKLLTETIRCSTLCLRVPFDVAVHIAAKPHAGRPAPLCNRVTWIFFRKKIPLSSQ